MEMESALVAGVAHSHLFLSLFARVWKSSASESVKNDERLFRLVSAVNSFLPMRNVSHYFRA
jgi:hypothetical protein